MKMVEVTVISPVYNEENNLKELVKRVSKTLKTYIGKKWEFIVVNDNSTDNSARILTALEKKYPNLRVFTHEKNKGQTGCFDTGFKNAKGSIVITMDGDLEVYPEDIPKFLDKMKEKDVDVVNGIRTNRKHTHSIHFASRMYNILLFLIFKTTTYDSASNYTAFRKKFIKGINLKKNDHRYILPIVMRRGAKTVEEVIINHDFRKSGMSKYRALNKFLYGFIEMVGFYCRLNCRKEFTK